MVDLIQCRMTEELPPFPLACSRQDGTLPQCAFAQILQVSGTEKNLPQLVF